jgi:flagellar hook protein FlgE
MALTPALNTATSGLRATSLRASSAAGNIANLLTPGYEATTVSQKTVYSGTNPGGGTAVDAQLIGSGLAPDLGQELTRLIEAETVYRANAEVLNTASQISRQTLDALA